MTTNVVKDPGDVNSEVIELQVRKRNMRSKGLSLPLRASKRQSH